MTLTFQKQEMYQKVILKLETTIAFGEDNIEQVAKYNVEDKLKAKIRSSYSM